MLLGWGGGMRGDSAFCFVFLMRMNILMSKSECMMMICLTTRPEERVHGNCIFVPVILTQERL